MNSFKAHRGVVYNLLFIKKNEKTLLVTLGTEGMKIWTWDDILNKFDLKPVDSISCSEYEVFNTASFNEKVRNLKKNFF